MARNQFQDIKKTDLNRNKFSKKNYVPEDFSDIFDKNASEYKEVEKKGNKHALWIVAFVSVVFLFFAISFLFSKAVITVNPKVKPISLNQNMTGVKDPNADGLPFDLIVFSDEESRLIQSGEEKDFNESAKGKVVIYNKYSTAPQPLLIDTRLEGSNGKIYKTKTKVTVPGMSKDKTPGKVSVDIYAIEEGSEYNSPPIDFRVLGFKGTPKYLKFDGRSVGDISGGIVGKSRQVSEEQKISAEKELKLALENKLFAKAASQIPPGFILFKEATVLKIEETIFSKPSTDGSVTLNIKGTINGFIFNEKKLTKKIVESIMPEHDGSDIYISNIKDLTFAFINKQNISLPEATIIDFNIYGVPKVVYRLDSEKLASSLISRNKKDFNKILLGYPNIDSAELFIKPIWKSTFPEKIDKIKIITVYP